MSSSNSAMSFICASCLRSRHWSLSLTKVQHASFRLPPNNHNYSTARDKPPRVGIIGSGPAGFYAARRLQQKMPGVKIDMYEMLPTPFGLVRFGVAPDHPEVKNCINTFTEVAEHPSFTFVGNVSIGNSATALPLSSLVPNYDALLFAYGASKDKRLGLSGEDLRGVHSARAFVGWYNGLPEYSDLRPDLQKSDRAVIIGQGNVAMDVARILLSPLSKLRATDITEEALEALSRSKIRNVKIVGRRGPLQAAYTTKELRELVTLENSHLSPVSSEILPSQFRNVKDIPRGALRRQIELLLKGSSTSAQQAERQWSLNYLLSPERFASSGSGSELEAVHFHQNEYLPFDGDTELADLDLQQASQKLRGMRVQQKQDSEPVIHEAGLAFRSVGYKSEALEGLQDVGVPFDDKLGIIPNDIYGRIISPSEGPGGLTAGHVPGMYAAGWVKRGPTGVIASTMDDAFVSADVIRQDWESGATFIRQGQGQAPGWDAVKQEAERRNIRSVSWEDWMKIDAEEKRRGKDREKEREKCKSVGEMLKILDG
ncbi:hypothetical protein BDZ85DRAFT_289564 [Elsinoe ampelina]|uniref:NADPH:adrenodoxin oxidoreductase, mitochondrial n=1 Tax=Elsinoe ampelina TaxID=302913 RepID=A0A6A6GB43_9PEZI|nr:hypothetical protein BDZ85DRAFT_289564 [Elsinoe ampelina]